MASLAGKRRLTLSDNLPAVSDFVVRRPLYRSDLGFVGASDMSKQCGMRLTSRHGGLSMQVLFPLRPLLCLQSLSIFVCVIFYGTTRTRRGSSLQNRTRARLWPSRWLIPNISRCLS